MENKKSNNSLIYTTIKRNIKYPRIEYKTGNVVIVVPKDYNKEKQLIERHKLWIQNKKSSISAAKKLVENKKLDESKEKHYLQEFIQKKADKFCNQLNTKINKIYLRKMKTKWGSCSQNHNLTLNTLTAYLPEHLIEYIVFHEIVHTLERKHTEKFWSIIERKFKDHQQKEMELFGYWFLIEIKLLTMKI